MIESRSLLCVVLGLMGLAAYIGTKEPDGPADPMLAPRERILRDLTLDARRQSEPVDITAGSDVWIEAKLINRSTRTTHRVVKPGEGSVVWGAREPYIYYTATVDRGDGKPTPLPESPRGWLCGNSLSGWVRDAVELRPGEALSLPSSPALPFDFQTPGEVAVRVHYAYRGGAARGHHSPLPPDQRGILKDVPTFELVSQPIRLRVVRPLDVIVKVKKPMTAGRIHLASEIVEVLLVNRSEGEIEVSSPTHSFAAPTCILIEGGDAAKLRYAIWDGDSYGIKVKLKPGESVPVIGPSKFANGHDAKWNALAPGMARVRASYTTTWESRVTILSEWVEVPVLK